MALGMSKRALGLLLALVLAGVATVSLLSYVRGVESRALEGVETVQAYVAKDTILEGTPADTAISNGLIVREAVPRKVVPTGALKSLTTLKGKVAAATIFKGEQIITARFIDPTDRGRRLRIPAERQAISVEVGIPPGVAGFIQAGSRVSVIAQVTVPKGGEQTEPKVQYLIQDVEVLAVGQRRVTVENEDKSQEEEVLTKVLVTLALTPPEAEKMAFAVLQGQVYFTLLPKDQKPVGTPGRTSSNIFS